ncbi:MAG: lipid-A-disaccharide synthase [Flavobacteriales bacterium]|nr:lipid-A-disaccharide synthase [Flavobacteriales bacterium]
MSAATGKRVYIIAGEASGDLHASNLVKALRRAHPEVHLRGWGGDRMAAAGVDVVKHIRELAFMGFAEVVMNLRTILRNITFCKEDITAFAPDVIVLVDYPGFNLRIAEFAKRAGIPVFYYISPQVWAWKAGRARQIKRDVDHLAVILPFEKAWYAERGMEVEFVGHPLLDAIEEEGRSPLRPLPGGSTAPVIALLPGSRLQEVSRMLPVMLRASASFNDHQRVVAAAPSLPDEAYRELIGGQDVVMVRDRTYDVLRMAKAALVTSGTATLETALFGVPEAVCYSGGALNVWLAKRLVNVPFISLVNLIMEREVVREMIQEDLTAEKLRAELDRLLHDAPYRERMVRDLYDLRARLGGPGASEKAARSLWKILPPTA